MSSTRIEIDLNALDDEGLTRARIEDADGEIAVGDDVLVFESEDGLIAPAKVTRADVSSGYVFLTVDWDNLREESFDYSQFLISTQSPLWRIVEMPSEPSLTPNPAIVGVNNPVAA
jgi:hypothetical protein